MGALIDRVGRRYGIWTVIGPSERRDGAGAVYWLCRCDCGTEREVSSARFRNGQSKSCGCKKNEAISKANRTHGLTKHPLYRRWESIMKRCYCPSKEGKYRARGITVCERWQDPANFIADNEHLALPGLSIDRIDNDGPYSPENCRWVDGYVQANNTRKNKMLTHNGKTQTIAQWARELGMTNGTLWSRLMDYGWSVEKALTTPVAPTSRCRRI